jgi:UDP-glucose-4-epimerase GalE
MINILVTGGAGFIGSHVCKSLAQNGYTPITLDNLSRGHEKNVKWGPFIKGSIHDFELVKKILVDYKIAAVMHFAAYAYVFESVEKPNLYFENNFYGSLLLIEAMKAAKVKKILFSSSCAIFGESQENSISEEQPKNPINPYGLSKLLVENMLEKYQSLKQIEFCSLRYFNAAGADPDNQLYECHHPEPHIIPNLINSALDNSIFKVYGADYPTPDGTCVRDYIHVTDLAEAHILALEKILNNQKINSFYNLGNSRGFSILELISMTEKILNKKIKVKIESRRKGDPSHLIGNPESFMKDFNWQTKFSDIETIIQTASKHKM